MAEGWIKLHRKLLDCILWVDKEPFDRRSAWIDLLLLANHSDKDILFNGKPITISKGQYLTSVRKLASRWGWSNDRTLRFLRLLETLKMIQKNSDSSRTLITIVNYGVYQTSPNSDEYTDEYSDKYTDKSQTRKKECKNEKNISSKEETREPYFENKELNSAFEDFIKFRKEIKAKMTDRAIELAIEKVKKLSNGNDETAIAIINQSIQQGWKGLFELKEERNGGNGNKYNYNSRKQSEPNHSSEVYTSIKGWD